MNLLDTKLIQYINPNLTNLNAWTIDNNVI